MGFSTILQACLKEYTATFRALLVVGLKILNFLNEESSRCSELKRGKVHLLLNMNRLSVQIVWLDDCVREKTWVLPTISELTSGYC